MRVRVYDKYMNTYFKSDVFAKINTGWYEKQLVIVPSPKGPYVKFYDYLDKSDPNNAMVMINMITPEIPNEWINQRSSSVSQKLLGFEKLLDENTLFFEFIGYPWLIENKEVLIELINGKDIAVKGSIFENKCASLKLDNWTYIESKEDASFLLEQASGFHDSIINKLDYVSGSYVSDNRSMNPLDSKRQVTILIESQIRNPIEMVFEGVTALNLRPARDNYTANIFSASLLVKDASVFFCDDHIQDIDESYSGTWIKAYSLRWRFIKM